MIGKLRGKVDAVGESYLLIDVNGVGYEVQASAKTLRNLKAGDDVTLTIDTHVREDAIKLFGFQSEHERSWFRTLQSIQGVGAKVALAVLSVLAPQDLANAIALGNWAAVEESPGVGKKLAQRIVMELKDKAPALSVAGLHVPAGAPGKWGVGCGDRQPRGGGSDLCVDQFGLQSATSLRCCCRGDERARRYGRNRWSHQAGLERIGEVGFPPRPETVSDPPILPAFGGTGQTPFHSSLLLSLFPKPDGGDGHLRVACGLAVCSKELRR